MARGADDARSGAAALRGRAVLAQHGQEFLVRANEEGLVAGPEPGTPPRRVLQQRDRPGQAGFRQRGGRPGTRRELRDAPPGELAGERLIRVAPIRPCSAGYWDGERWRWGTRIG